MIKRLAFVSIIILTTGCKFYSFTGASIPDGAKSVQINFFINNAGNSINSVFEPGFDRDFTNALQETLLNQTNLDLVSVNGDLIYEGEIEEYRISPMTATADDRAAQNRLTVSINVRYFNTKGEEDDFEKRFSFFYDYDAAVQLQTVKTEAHDIIFERITQDIFNESLAKW